jgi:superfamily II DNA/RNA helicase
MEQFKEELLKHRPYFKHRIQFIGDNYIEYKDDKLITICVYNSISILEEHLDEFEKIFVDEAHHINMPEIYKLDNDEYIEEITEDEEDNDTNIDDIEKIIEDTEIDSSYINIIKSFSKYKNNVYLSATIDEIDGFLYYKKDIRDMIDNNYLCDYTIHIPIFTDDPTNRNICEYVLKYYRNIIIYCNSQKEGKHINKLINSIQSNSCEYIDCNTSRKKRNDIINKYKNGSIPYLVNVRILIEGFDAPITKGVVFLHMPKSQTTLIQIIGRALRLHNLKSIANIILPYSNKEDEKNISTFLKVISRNDKRIKKSYENKKLGGYIAIDYNGDEIEEENDDEIELKYELIYNSIGKLLNGKEIWYQRLEEVKKYMDEHKERPDKRSLNNTIKKLGQWMGQQSNYYTKKIYTMKNIKIYKSWTEFITDENYKEIFISKEDIWYLNFNKLKEYIIKHKERQVKESKTKSTAKLGQWISNQLISYKNKDHRMKIPKFYDIFTKFLNDPKFKEYFMDRIELWYLNLNKVKDYLDKHGEKPSIRDSDNHIVFLGHWLINQTGNYKIRKDIMKDENIRNVFSQFINDPSYKKYFKSYEEIWYTHLNNVKQYMDKYKEKPMSGKTTEITFLSKWLTEQAYNYLNKQNTMKIQEIYDSWTEFINNPTYKQYLKSNNETWYENLEAVKQYMDKYHKKPVEDSEDNKIARWISTQNSSYRDKTAIMKNEEIYKAYTDFLNDDRYKQYMLNDKEIWLQKLDKLKDFLIKNNKKPTPNNKNEDIKCIGNWLSKQTINYRKKEGIFKNNEFYIKWTEFINYDLYKKYFE